MSSAFDWRERYATGIISIDAQHITLFQAARELNNAYRSGKANEKIPHMLNLLLIYCANHFEDEEAHMERLGYPGLVVQQDRHRQFLAHVYDLRERYAKGDSAIPMELSVLIVSWFKKHIKECDQGLANFIRQQEAEGDAKDCGGLPRTGLCS